ncbi:MAG TPA: AzlD domain-containing protein [Bacillota bacterium]|nr:AzlD domain-containing protein [Clostridiales bacterium]HPT85158.1 AzlD domain-containing protein [Bacillota bacterium]
MRPSIFHLCVLAAVTAAVTYLVRIVPLAVWRGKFKNAYVRSFFTYVPYGVLAALVFPGVLYSTESMIPSLIGGTVALGLSLAGGKLLIVSGASVLAVLATELILRIF